MNLICGELNNIDEFNKLGDLDRKRKSGKANNKLLRMEKKKSSFTIFIRRASFTVIS